jgi:hypothetical protein
MSYTGVPVGTGDGTNKKFKLPSRNIKQDTLVLKKNGTTMSEGVDYTKRPIREVNHLNYCGVSHGQGGFSSYPIYFKRVRNTPYWFGEGTYQTMYGDFVSGAAFQRAKVSNGSASMGWETDPKWDSDGNGLIFNGYDNKFWDMSSGSPVVRTDITFSPALTGGAAGHVAFSPDGQHLAILQNNQKVKRYKRNGLVFEILPEVSGEPVLQSSNGTYYGDMMYVGDYLFVGSYTANKYLVVFKRNGDNYTLCTVNGTTPDTWSYSFIMSDDGTNMLASGASDTVQRYTVANDVFTRVATIPIPGKGESKFIFKLSDGLVAIWHSGGTYLTIYEWDGAATLTEISTASASQFTYAYGIVSLGDDNTIFAGGNSSTKCIDISPLTTQITFTTAPALNDAITADYSVNGIHKTNQYVIDLQISVQYGEGV